MLVSDCQGNLCAVCRSKLVDNSQFRSRTVLTLVLSFSDSSYFSSQLLLQLFFVECKGALKSGGLSLDPSLTPVSQSTAAPQAGWRDTQPGLLPISLAQTVLAAAALAASGSLGLPAAQCRSAPPAAQQWGQRAVGSRRQLPAAMLVWTIQRSLPRRRYL